ncbi:MAG: nucleoside triphosphate pyrophosphohydrolase [Ruminococcaceae bacterium]|nr:nucleoside triphosphate pyrophosphohydrolase [Oscillospiraceae bacterium]
MTVEQNVQDLMKKTRYDFSDLCAIMSILRSDAGCPWDREQDHHSIRKCLIEETYEVVEAIDTENPALLREELGDLLFQILFHAEIERERQTFSLDDVIHEISVKMIHRHPHVFGNVQVRNSADVLQNWESIKTEEKQRNTKVEKLRAIPPMMPALMRATKVGKKAGQAEGESVGALTDAVSAHLSAFHDANPEQMHERMGKLLMAVCNLSRAVGVDPEHALMDETDHLIDRVAKEEECK